MHKNNEARQAAFWLKTIPAYFTRPPPDLTVRSQDTTSGYCQECQAGWWKFCHDTTGSAG